MAGPKIFDRVKETTTTTGTGAVTLAGAASGYRAFSDVLADTNTCLYAIVGQSSTEWEVGLGTFASGANTITRTTVLASSNGGSAVNFSAGTKDIFIDLPAAFPTYIHPTNTYANLAALQDGRLNLPSDSFYHLRDTGGALAPWGPIYPMTLPVDGDFAWINQGSATVDATKGGIFLYGPAAAAFNLRIRKKAKSPPYTITAAFTMIGTLTANSFGGVLWRESGSGKLVTFIAAGGQTLQLTKWNDPNTAVSNYVANVAASYGQPIWVRLADDNTNRIVSMSQDGQNFVQLHSVGRTDFMTADEVGFYVSAETRDFGLTLLSWKET